MKQGISILYSNSYVGALSTKLIKRESFVRMIESGSVNEAVKVLYEHSYGDGLLLENSYEFDKLLFAEEKSLLELFRELSAVDACTLCFLLPYDYLNAKTAIKSKYMRTLPPTQNALSGVYDSGTLMTSIQTDDYNDFSEDLKNGLEEIDRQFYEGNRTPNIIDNILDVAMYSDIFKALKKCGSDAVKKYYMIEVDCKNILAFFRAKSANVSMDTIGFLKGGKIPSNAYLEIKDKENNKLLEFFTDYDYKKLCEECIKAVEEGSGFSVGESISFELKRQPIFEQRNNNDGIEPLIAYFLAKKTEISNVRLILVGLKAGLTPSVISERLKESYV